MEHLVEEDKEASYQGTNTSERVDTAIVEEELQKTQEAVNKMLKKLEELKSMMREYEGPDKERPVLGSDEN